MTWVESPTTIKNNTYNLMLIQLIYPVCQDACPQIPAFDTPRCGTHIYVSQSHLICQGEQCEITVTFWYLENSRGRGRGCSPYNFPSFPRHINMLITVSQHCRAIAGFQNRSNQTCGVESVALYPLINYQTWRNPFYFKVYTEPWTPILNKDTKKQSKKLSLSQLHLLCKYASSEL